MVDVRHDHDEFVAAEARQQVVVAGHVGDPRGDLFEQLVAGLVAVHVVDLLEVVDVEEQRRQHFLVARGFLELAREIRLQQVAVGQVGQRIVGRDLLQPRLDRLALGDFEHQAALARTQVVEQPVRRQPRDHEHRDHADQHDREVVDDVVDEALVEHRVRVHPQDRREFAGFVDEDRIFGNDAFGANRVADRQVGELVVVGKDVVVDLEFDPAIQRLAGARVVDQQHLVDRIVDDRDVGLAGDVLKLCFDRLGVRCGEHARVLFRLVDQPRANVVMPVPQGQRDDDHADNQKQHRVPEIHGRRQAFEKILLTHVSPQCVGKTLSVGCLIASMTRG